MAAHRVELAGGGVGAGGGVVSLRPEDAMVEAMLRGVAGTAGGTRVAGGDG